MNTFSKPVSRVFTLQGMGVGELTPFTSGSDDKESACNAGDVGSIPGLGRSSGEGNGKALQYSCLGNTTNRGAWRATIYEVAKSQT